MVGRSTSAALATHVALHAARIANHYHGIMVAVDSTRARASTLVFQSTSPRYARFDSGRGFNARRFAAGQVAQYRDVNEVGASIDSRPGTVQPVSEGRTCRAPLL